MPEMINALFGRSKNDTADSGEDVAAAAAVQTDDPQSGGADVAVTDEPVDTTAPEGTESVPGADDADDQADDEAAVETAAEESDEAAIDEDLTDEAAEVSDEDGESAEDSEPVAVDDTPEAAETDADDADQTESAAEPVTAETQPAAGTRGSVTVGDGVVAKVVNIVTSKIDGVHSLDDDGISVALDDDVATIKVSLAVEYGHAIKALAERIRTDVIEAVEQFLGLEVAAVDVHVSDIHPSASA